MFLVNIYMGEISEVLSTEVYRQILYRDMEGIESDYKNLNLLDGEEEVSILLDNGNALAVGTVRSAVKAFRAHKAKSNEPNDLVDLLDSAPDNISFSGSCPPHHIRDEVSDDYNDEGDFDFDDEYSDYVRGTPQFKTPDQTEKAKEDQEDQVVVANMILDTYLDGKLSKDGLECAMIDNSLPAEIVGIMKGHYSLDFFKRNDV